jgi:putative tricarboxylic transport membrane protein
VSRADVLSGLVWLLVGAGVAWGGWDLGLGALRDPGSGFLLFWIGLIMVALSLIVIAAGLRAPTLGAAWSGTRWRNVAGVVAALVAYAWLLPRLGFLITTTALLVFLFKAIEPQRWWVAAAGAVATALVAYVVFKVWLGAQLPGGWLEIG